MRIYDGAARARAQDHRCEISKYERARQLELRTANHWRMATVYMYTNVAYMCIYIHVAQKLQTRGRNYFIRQLGGAALRARDSGLMTRGSLSRVRIYM